jgi:hypothetical protein
LLSQIETDEQLIELYTKGGFLVAVNYPKNEIKLHTIDCMLADPISTVGVKPTKSIETNTGEFWYSKERSEANKKAEKIAKENNYTYMICRICNR